MAPSTGPGPAAALPAPIPAASGYRHVAAPREPAAARQPGRVC
eukprot:COSAG04_NODE_22722_length_350_cov_0.812749_1_plen_42_part_10